MGIVRVENIRLYAYHGCLEEEALIGSDYRVDVSVKADLKKAAVTDNLEDTVDYVHIQYIVNEEMKIRSKLLEHAGNRILERIFKEIPMVLKGTVSVSKLNPPIGGNTEAVTVIMKAKRS
jgi:dihydroneopterin aldolase